MEEIAEGVSNINIAGESQKKNRIQVSNTKKPLFFYVNLAKVLPFFCYGFLDFFNVFIFFVLLKFLMSCL